MHRVFSLVSVFCTFISLWIYSAVSSVWNLPSCFFKYIMYCLKHWPCGGGETQTSWNRTFHSWYKMPGTSHMMSLSLPVTHWPKIVTFGKTWQRSTMDAKMIFHHSNFWYAFHWMLPSIDILQELPYEHWTKYLWSEFQWIDVKFVHFTKPRFVHFLLYAIQFLNDKRCCSFCHNRHSLLCENLNM